MISSVIFIIGLAIGVVIAFGFGKILGMMGGDALSWLLRRYIIKDEDSARTNDVNETTSKRGNSS